jgi:FkbM family methyltransferase
MLAEPSTVVQVETVQVKRLDDVIGEVSAASASRSIYLKLDTQGYDLEVIKGAGATLESVAALQTEVSVSQSTAECPTGSRRFIPSSSMVST